MADAKNTPAMMNLKVAPFGRQVLRAETLAGAERLREIVRPGVIPPATLPQPAPPPAPTQPGVPPPTPSRPLPAVPVAPANNPFKDLPFPSPGDRIRADDFKQLSQSLKVIHEASLLSGALFGRSFGEAKQVLAAQQYAVSRVMSVFGSEIDSLSDTTLDARKVVQVVPVELGERGVAVVVTEAVETRRFAPNLLGLSYREAAERLQAMLGDLTFPSAPMTVSQLVGLTLAEARRTTQG